MTKILRFRKQKHLLKEYKTKITRRNLKYLDKLVNIKEKERKEHEKETKREPQLPVSASEVSVPTDTP
jgi:hypothetical protein